MMHVPNTPFNSLLCLNGENIAVALFDAFDSIPLIATDGAAQKLDGIRTPDIVIGDFDSTEKSGLSECSRQVHIQDQDTTDFEKALSLIAHDNLAPTLVLGIHGGEVDHSLNNMHVFAKYSRIMPLTFCDLAAGSVLKYGVLVDKPSVFTVRVGATVSLIPFPQVRLSTKGLQWDLNTKSLSLTEQTSARNCARQENIEVIVYSGQCFFIA